MRYITEQELRDSFAGGVPPRFVLPADCRLTPLAEQYLRDLKLLGGESLPDPAAEAGAHDPPQQPGDGLQDPSRASFCAASWTRWKAKSCW